MPLLEERGSSEAPLSPQFILNYSAGIRLTVAVVEVPSQII